MELKKILWMVIVALLAGVIYLAFIQGGASGSAGATGNMIGGC